MSEIPSTFDEYLAGLGSLNGNLINVVANDISQLAALPAGDRMKLIARLGELGLHEGVIKELQSEMARANSKKTNAPKKSAKVGASTEIRNALKEMGYDFKLNLVRERIERDNGSVLHDGEVASIIASLFDHGLSNKSLMNDIILAQAWVNSYDPLLDFFNGLVWDGEDHIRKLSYYFEDAHPLIEYPNGEKRTVFAAWLRRWLIGAAGKMRARVQNPMLVIAGDQGMGKSEFPRWLCSPLADYFVESAINPESVDHQRWAAGNFIWEVGELGATTRKADVEALKAFITRHEHSFRVPYAKNEVHRAARVSFLGTVNPDNAGFLTDPTGNRRFLTVEVTAINWKGYTTDIDVRQVWAQAYAIYQQNPDAWKLDESETAIRDAINGEFNVDDPVRDAILALYDVIPHAATDGGCPFTSSADLVYQVGTQIKYVSTKSLQMDVSRAMKRLNVTKVKRNNINGYFGVSKRLIPTSFQPSSNLKE
jgi:predicted P-loop ATPase